VSEVEDCFEYLVPLAQSLARRFTRELGIPHGEVLTSALEGAWIAAKGYDAHRNKSLWNHGWGKIRNNIIDEVRREYGRSKQRRNFLAPKPMEFEEWIFEPFVERGYNEFEDRSTVRAVLDALSPMQRYILTQVFIEGRTLVNLGEELGVGEARACQITNKALRTARELLAA
jgi:RNA polymerase sigma factor (sigma-70 family)